MSTKELIQNVAITALVVAGVVALVVILLGIGDHNRAKVERMTELCVDHGFGAWVDAAGVSTCVGQGGAR